MYRKSCSSKGNLAKIVFQRFGLFHFQELEKDLLQTEDKNNFAKLRLE
jgi:hypothetical protein